MTNQAARQASSYFIRQRQRSRQFSKALTVHAAGLVVKGADQFGGFYLSGAMFVQDANGLPWVALTSGTTGAASSKVMASSTMVASLVAIRRQAFVRSADARA